MSLRGDFDSHVDELADSIENGTLRTFHGCRTDDAGLYFREGLRVHDRSTLTAKLRTIIEENPELDFMRDRMEAAIQEVNNVTDEGRLYVVADDTALLRFAAHYLIYGSEWIVAVLGEPGRRILRNVGVPTLLEIDLPLSMAGSGVRRELASKMLKEWARFACNTPDWSAPIDFSICLRSDIPASCIVGHTHPIELPDPLQGRSLYRPDATTCAYCG
ncbi:hypothetical protein [Ensifer sp.]|uniref:hypothetical protein n=1 Tax=Ensifer sp. TaxID=1872086 RepID=UPI0028A1EBAF|nr:hypothetical protein [Ensifer sp.]